MALLPHNILQKSTAQAKSLQGKYEEVGRDTMYDDAWHRRICCLAIGAPYPTLLLQDRVGIWEGSYLTGKGMPKPHLPNYTSTFQSKQIINPYNTHLLKKGSTEY